MAAKPVRGDASNSFFLSQQIIHTVIIFIISLLAVTVETESATGCILYEEICDENEICVPDGLYGECASSEDVALIVPEPTDQTVTELIRSQLEQLDRDGYILEDARTQCLIAYFKLVLALQLSYDPNFCDVNSPENVWRMLQLVKLAFVQNAPALQDGISAEELADFVGQKQQQQALIGNPEGEANNGEADELSSAVERNVLQSSDALAPVVPDDVNKGDTDGEIGQGNIPTVENLIAPVIQNPGEEEEEQSVNFVDGQAPVLKKDIEHLGEQNTGLENIEHKIVKGAPPFEKVDGSRVYLKVAEGLNEDQLYQLIDYLDHSIALPNKLVFSDFQLDGDQLSFRAGRSSIARPRNEKRLDSVEGIAEAVYKRRKDIQSLSGVRVDETGIGSGEEAIPVEGVSRDRFYLPILLVSAFTIAALITVMAAHQIREHRRKKREAGLPEIGSDYDGKASATYQDLCRHRISSHETASTAEPHSKHSSTSSWVEEPISQSNLDISTGHVILSFLRDYLNETSKIEEQWKALEGYTNPNGIASVAEKEENIDKNRNPNCLPYDDTLVSVQWALSGLNAPTYINASAIHDSDPKQASYIATQSPLPTTIVDFWQMIWEQGTVLVVNLANDDDQREERCTRYWPGSGSQVYGSFEIHLVSEHIWSENYLVRSFYLKNLKTNETRTVTQFHFLTWPKKGVPPNTKALLDFRRKINKSYRGRAAPIVVQSTDGTGRTGTYCLLDMVLNRVANGVKELNVAGSLEYLRDQRPGMVETCEQYKMVFVCLAEEITALVAALPQ